MFGPSLYQSRVREGRCEEGKLKLAVGRAGAGAGHSSQSEKREEEDGSRLHVDE
jgi:hypothetical protein